MPRWSMPSIFLAMMLMAARLGAQGPAIGSCLLTPETFALKNSNLPVGALNGGVFFTARMTVDADGAPNAYGPRNTGLDYTANARGAHGWVALVTKKRGNPVRQRIVPYRGFYVSTTSLAYHDMK